MRRLAAELALFGYRVEVAPPATGELALAQLLARTGGAALLAVDQRKQAVEVVIAAPAGAAMQERELLDPRRRPETNAAVLAERFRARLTELGIAPGAATALSEPVVIAEPLPAPPPRTVAPAAPRLWLAGALGVTQGGLGFNPDAQLELRAFAFPWLSTSAVAKLSLAPQELREPEGETDVRVQAGGLLIDVYPVRGEWTLKVGVGALLVNAGMVGESGGSWRGEEVSVLVPAGIVDAGGALRLSSRVSLELTGFIGVCAPRIGIKFAGRTVAHYGRPFYGGALGLGVGLL